MLKRVLALVASAGAISLGVFKNEEYQKIINASATFAGDGGDWYGADVNGSADYYAGSR